jgi:Skp family chaperone for outer membrane proteins
VAVVQDSLQQVFNTKLEEYQTFDQSAVATDAARQERQQELLQIRNDIEQAEVQGLQYLSYAEARLLQPVLNQIDQAIQAEASEGGYDLVLPTVANNAPVFLYRSERVDDLTVPIMERLGIDPNAAPVGQQQPGPPAPPIDPPSPGAGQ